MKTRKILSLALAALMLAALFSACTPKESPVDPNADALFPFSAVNDEKAIKGGTLKVGLNSEDGFKSLLSWAFYDAQPDYDVIMWFDENMVSADENFVFDQDGPCTYEVDRDAKTITLTMKKGIKWHDGEPVTLDDLVFAHEVICHPDYQGIRYGDQLTNVVGAEEYHNGTADTISGLDLSADKMKLTISFKEFTPTILVGGFWIAAIPRHYLGDIAVKDMPNHERVRSKPIGFGPFKVVSVVPGEAVEYVRYDDYWRGKPKLDGVSLKVISAEMVAQAMESGDIDLCMNFPTAKYNDYRNPTNYQYVGELATVFNYTAFDLGDFDIANNICVNDPTKKMSNLNLRKAIGYAVDMNVICEEVYYGLRFPATTAITPRHAGYQHKDLKGYYYDPEKAKALLDEAGYIDIDGDGYREDPDGNQLTISWGHMTGAGAETISQSKIQNWKDVGLRVELWNGRLTEMSVFYDALQYDEPGLDMFDGAWQTGFDPAPSNLWGLNTVSNQPHATTPELIAAMADCESEQSWDDEFRTNAYKKWQEQFFEDCTAIPTMWRLELSSVNNRVKNYDRSSPDIDFKLHLIELTATESFRK